MLWWHLWRRLCGDVVNVPGVVYSDEINIEDDAETAQRWMGGIRQIRMETAPPKLQGLAQAGPPELQEVPYTYMERMGLATLPASRIRPRQYYHPITDFALYGYDEVSPEEKHLTARWMSRVMDFRWVTPAAVLCSIACFAIPMPTALRMPLLSAAGFAGVAIEFSRAYMDACQERQDLDDFLLAKEIWYIKNVEVFQLGVPRLPRGREKEFQAYFTNDGMGYASEPIPIELLAQLHT